MMLWCALNKAIYCLLSLSRLLCKAASTSPGYQHCRQMDLSPWQKEQQSRRSDCDDTYGNADDDNTGINTI